MTTPVYLLSVFAAGPRGGNPAPIVADAAGMSDADMQEVARAYGHESGFVLPAPDGSGCDFAFRFWVPLKSVPVLDGLRPDFRRMEELCERIGSTGLYPYAWSDLQAQVFDARQFPKSSGYPEDAATGIAAAALAFGLLANGLVEVTGRPIRVRQGRAMGRPSEIHVRRDPATQGCLLGGHVEWAA